MSELPATNDRRNFLKTAGLLAVAGTVAGASACGGPSGDNNANGAAPGRGKSFDSAGHRALLVAVGETVLPESLGEQARAAAVTAFVAWCDGYDPVAEEMHGYGYADVRYLPPDPVPAWRAQLDGLDILAQRVHHAAFTALSLPERRAIVTTATRSIRGDRLPSPLTAPHVVIALLSHWASSPEGWNTAMNARVSPGTCRPLDDAVQQPVALTVAAGAQRGASITPSPQTAEPAV
jgi:hypothetical protein